MALIRKTIAFARATVASFFKSDGHPLPDATDLDLYLFDREARMNEAWGTELSDIVRRIGSDRIRPATMPRIRSFFQAFNGAFPRLHRSAKVTEPPPRCKLGLAFGGGFARVIAHIGVLKVLEEEKIPIDLIAGTSAGAILGAAYCAGMSAKEMEQMACTTRFRDFARMTLSRYGLYASDRMANFCERVLGIKTFEDLRIPLAVTATDVRTGDPVVFTQGPLADPIRASCAYPGMFPPVDVDGRSLIDGMLAYSVPTTPLREMGAGFVIGVCLSTDRPGQQAPRHIFDVIAQCFSIAEAKLSHLWKQDADLVIEPDIQGFSFDCFDRAKELIARGEAAARAALPQLRRLSNLAELQGREIAASAILQGVVL